MGEKKELQFISKFMFILLLSISFLFAQSKMPPIPVKVFTVNGEKTKINKAFSGVTKASNTVNIVSRVSGNIEKRYFKEGQKVKKGQLLYKIEQATYKAKVNQAKAVVNQAKAALTKASKDWERYKNLFKAKSISAYTKDQYLFNYQNAQANLDNAKASLNDAQINYNYTLIKAPISGLISTTKLDDGNFAPAGTMLTTITKINPVYVEFSLSQKDISKYLNVIKNGNAKLSINSNGKIYDQGKLTYVSPILDSSTDSLVLRATFDNPNQDIIIGQFTDVIVSDISIPNVTTIPEQAIFQKETMSLILVVRDGYASPQPVRTAGSNENGIMVAGLKEGDQVVISNLNKVLMGMMKGAKKIKVQIVPQKQGN